MLRKLLYSIFLMAVLFPGTVSAEGKYYGMDAMLVTYSEAGFPDFKPKVLGFKFGNQINANIAIEGRFGLGLTDDTQNFCIISCADLTFEIDNFLGAYMKFMPAGNETKLYGLLGFTKGKASVSALGLSATESETDLSYGFGVEVKVSEDAGVNFEYLQAIDKDTFELSSINIGFVSYF